LKQGRELLAIFLSLYGKKNIKFQVFLWRTSDVFHGTYVGDFWLHLLLGSDAENAILAVFQLYKAMQRLFYI
jgi:hypothetical protein